jgi:hypothetical protein
MGSGRNLADPDATVGEQERNARLLLMRILDRTERDSAHRYHLVEALRKACAFGALDKTTRSTGGRLSAAFRPKR